jgi:hypothetical protein
MKTRRLPILAGVVCFTLSATSAHAQSARYVSSGGSDANDCSRATPCLTLQRGVDVTPSSGVLHIVDSGAYGPATVTRNITISGDGTSATVGRITINSATARVVLRSLLLNGQGALGATGGLVISAASSVHVVRCEIERFVGNGILLNSDAELFVTDSVVRNNTLDGLNVPSAISGAKLNVDGSRFENNTGNGIRMGLWPALSRNSSNITRTVVSGNAGHGIVHDGGKMSITWSTVGNNGKDGIRHRGDLLATMDVAWSTAAGNGENGFWNEAVMTLNATTAANNGANGYGVGTNGWSIIDSSTALGNVNAGLLVSNASGRAAISNSVFTGNLYGVHNNGGLAYTRKTNIMRGNSTSGDIFGTLTTLAGQ